MICRVKINRQSIVFEKYRPICLLNTVYKIASAQISRPICLLNTVYKIASAQISRPIYLLNTVYKIASAQIASRIKTVIDKLISKDQSGFISGRYIGDNT